MEGDPNFMFMKEENTSKNGSITITSWWKKWVFCMQVIISLGMIVCKFHKMLARD